MSETLIDLDKQEEEKELAQFAEDYNDEDFWPELVLYTSLILRGSKSTPISELFSATASIEYKNEIGRKILNWLSCSRDFRRQLEYRGRVWISDRLPDVCGACFYSYGLCVSGRYRISCPQCKTEDTRVPFTLRSEPHRLCLYGEITDACLVQLIYKYYSPNGDPKWELKTYNLWKF